MNPLLQSQWSHSFIVHDWEILVFFTGVCLAVGIACMYAANIGGILHVSAESKETPSDVKKLVPAGGGARVWWRLFEHSKDRRRTPITKEGKLQRALSGIGRFALRSQTKRNPSIIAFFVAFSNKKDQKEIELEEFKKLIQDRVMANHERFRSRVSASDDRYFEILDGKDIDAYVSSPPHPKVHNTELAYRVQEYLTSPLDVREHLWEAEISTGPMGSSGAIRKDLVMRLAETRDRETVALFRVHHALCDGVSLSVAVGDLCDEADELDAAVAKLARKRKEKARKRTLFQWLMDVFRLIGFYTIGSVYAISLQVWRSIISVNPFEQVLAANGDGDYERVTTWRYAAPVDEIKKVAKSVSKSATLNDLMVACLTGAMYRQLEEHEKALEASGITLHIPSHINIVIPVHLTGGVLRRGQPLGNKIGAYVTAIPARGDRSPTTWLKSVSRNLMEGKTTPASLIAWSLAKFLSEYAPLSVAKWALRYGNGHASAVVSNVRGFPFATHWNGRRMEHLSAFLPIPPGIPIGIVVQSFDGVISFTVEAEKWAVHDADKFADWVLDEYNILKEAVFKEE